MADTERKNHWPFLFDSAALIDLKESAFKILAEIGVKFESRKARDILVRAGAKEEPSGSVRIPTEMVKACLKAAPESFMLHNIPGSPDVEVGGGQSYFTPGGAALFVLSPDGQSVREAVANDIAQTTKLVEELSHIALHTSSLVPSDVPSEVADCYRLFLILRHGIKPAVSGAFGIDGIPNMHALLSAAVGSEAELRARPRAMMVVCPLGPMRWTVESCSNIIDCARLGLPLSFGSIPIPGVSAPATLAGSVVVHTVETLSGLVLAQMSREGAAVVYGGTPMHFDMATLNSCLSTPEVALMIMGYNQIGKSFGLPTHTFAAISDSKGLDVQAGAETMMSGLIACLSGIDIITGAGLLEFSRVSSLEKLVADNDLCRMMLRIKRGIEFNKDTLAADLIADRGPGGEYISHPHTLKWFRKESCFLSPAMNRQARSHWAEAGAVELQERSHGLVERLTARQPAKQQHAEAVEQTMRDIMNKYDLKELPFLPD